MTAISRILLFAQPDDVDLATAALAAIADAEPVTMRITRLDGTQVTAHLIDVGTTVIEVAPGESAVPALIELLVSDLAAVTDRLTAVATPERGGVRVRIGGLTVSVRQEDQ